MSAISIPLSKMGTITAICELAAAMKVPATADFDENTPEGTALQMRAMVYGVNISIDQLETARKLLRLIFMSNRECFRGNGSVSGSATERSDSYDTDTRPAKEAYTRDDVFDAIALGAYAAKANIQVSDASEGRLYFNTAGSVSFYETIPDNDLHLARKLFEVICENNSFESKE